MFFNRLDETPERSVPPDDGTFQRSFDDLTVADVVQVSDGNGFKVIEQFHTMKPHFPIHSSWGTGVDDFRLSHVNFDRRFAESINID